MSYDTQFASLLEAGRFDAVGELARKVASHVTCELLGLSVEDAPILRERGPDGVQEFWQRFVPESPSACRRICSRFVRQTSNQQ